MYAIDKAEVFQMQDLRSVLSGHGHLVSGCMRVDYGWLMLCGDAGQAPELVIS